MFLSNSDIYFRAGPFRHAEGSTYARRRRKKFRAYNILCLSRAYLGNCLYGLYRAYLLAYSCQTLLPVPITPLPCLLAVTVGVWWLMMELLGLGMGRQTYLVV